MSEFEERQRWDLPAWPEMYAQLRELQAIVFRSDPGVELNLMVFTMASVASGCRHCQAHGAYGLDRLGVDVEKIRAIWSFESSPLFDERERAALRFGMAAGSVPNSVDPTIHSALRANFTDAEVRTLLGVAGISGFMNRYNDSLATVTDQASADWAAANLSAVGWDLGRHLGAPQERREAPPTGTR